MAATNKIKILFGTSLFGGLGGFTFDEAVEQLAEVEKLGITHLDGAYGYGASEAWLGKMDAGSRFTIDSKHPGGLSAEPATKENVLEKMEESLRNLGVDQVNIYYLHAPDARVPLKETLSAINDLHKAGKFTHFGLSQFSAAEIEQVITIAKENNYILPTFAQSNYNAITRRAEKEVFPLLRQHGIAFYAYSPIAGGFLAKSPEQIKQPSSDGDSGAGRWNSPDNVLGTVYGTLYNKPAMLSALEAFNVTARDAGISRAELAYRWIAYHSILSEEVGDGIVLGARNVGQLRATVEGLKRGPLSEEVAGRVSGLWEENGLEGVAPLDNWDGFAKEAFGGKGY
ncbi:hypothetical protein FQN52_001174 [Onygenales sp. PD_12]|nr:hypothetical protein FQN52_001174 [Onygenales sp. PD_12]